MNKSAIILAVLFSVSSGAYAAFESPGGAAQDITPNQPVPNPSLVPPPTQTQPAPAAIPDTQNQGGCGNSTNDTAPGADVPSTDVSAPPVQGS